MKKIIFSLVGLGFFATTFAQEAFDKKMQFGIAFGAGINNNKTSNIMTSNGAGFDGTVGLNLNYNMNSTITINTGLEFDFESFSYTPKDTLLYYYSGNDIVKKYEYEEKDPTTILKDYNLFSLTERQYKTTYLTVPIFMMLKTKPFGNMQYFGKFGGRVGFKIGGKINDKGYNFVKDSIQYGYSAELAENTEMVLEDDIRGLKINAGLSGGTMWNFSGTTMLVAELGYYFGVTQIHKGERISGDDKMRSFTLLDLGTDRVLSDRKYTAPSATQGQLMLKLTLFF